MAGMLILLSFVSGCTGGAQLAGVPGLSPGVSSPPTVPGEVLVRFIPGARAETAISSIGGIAIGRIPKIEVWIVRFPGRRTTEEVLKALRQRDDVVYAEPHYLGFVPEDGRPSAQPTRILPKLSPSPSVRFVPNDPSYPDRLWGLVKIAAPGAWDITTGGSNVVIAVLDTGVDSTHPDLSGKVLSGANCTSGVCTLGPTPDGHSHGTHVAGTAAALGNNAGGIVGVAFNSVTQVLPVKVCTDGGSCSVAAVASGIIWATDQVTLLGKKGVLNMSLGGPGYSQVLQDAVAFALGHPGILVVAAMGNDYKRWGIVYPAALPGVMAVGATDGTDNKTNFSNTGAHISIVAPGLDIYSSVPSGFGSYAYFSGTSMAAPHASGLAALVWSANPALTNYDVRRAVEVSAADLGSPGWDETFGWGRINAAAAVTTIPAPYYGCAQVDVQSPGPFPEAFADVILTGAGIRRTAKTSGMTSATSVLGRAIFDFLPLGVYTVTASDNLGFGIYYGAGSVMVPPGAPAICGAVTILLAP